MMESGYCDVIHLEEKAARIGQALAAAAVSTEKYFMRGHAVKITDELTVREARAIACDLKKDSHVGILEIQKAGNTPSTPLEVYGMVVEPLLEAAIQHYSEVKLNFDLNNIVAKTLGALLLSLADDASNTLQTLKLCIGPYMTMDGAQLLANGLRHAKVKSLDLAVGGFCRHNNVVLVICQAALQSVEKLVMRASLDGETARVIGRVLIGNTTLQSFEFKLLDLSIDAATTLANGISRSHIICLNVQENLCAVAEDVLYEGVAKLPTLCYLTVGDGFCRTPGLAQCLARLYSLTIRHCSTEMMANYPAFLTGLRNASRLTTLVLRHDRYQPHDIVYYCAVLPHLTSLTDLTIMCCKLALEEWHDDGNDDESLDRESRRFQATGAEQIMVAVANHPSLVRLTLIDCSDMEFTALEMIGMHLPNIKLKELHLGVLYDEDYFELDDCIKWAKPSFQRACQALIAGVRVNWNLRELTRCEDPFPPKVEDEIDFYLHLNKSGRYLIHDSDSNKVPTGLWCHVLAKCGSKAGLVYYHLREQPTLLLAAGMCHNKSDCNVHDGPRVCMPAGTKRRRKE